MSDNGRNDSCPCGSGKKFKKCCLFKGRPQSGPEELARKKLVQELLEYANRFHKDALPRAFVCFWGGERPDDQFIKAHETFYEINFSEWLLMDFHVDPEPGRTIVELYREKWKNLAESERAVLERFRNSVISLFEVQEVFPEKGLILNDLLLGGEYEVWEKSATRALAQWDILAARLLLVDGRHIICGSVYPYAVRRKQNLIDTIRKNYEKYKKAVPDAALRDYLKANGASFNSLWYDGAMADTGPVFLTKTGEPLVFCRSAFVITARHKIIELLKGHDRLEPDDKNGFIWSKHPGRDGASVLGTIRINKNELILECMSKKRLEEGKKLILDALSGLVEHKTDTYKDPYEVMARLPKKTRSAAEIPPEIKQQLYDKFMREHLTKWLDEKIPALGGLTPRECVKTDEGREKVANLLKSYENFEDRKRKAGDPFHDVSWVWTALGLKRPD